MKKSKARRSVVGRAARTVGARNDGAQLTRLRRVCLAMPQVTERLSHGEPTFFAGKRVMAMFSNNHHDDGHIAVIVPAAPGEQARLIAENPTRFYRPAYVGVAGWVGIELAEIVDAELQQMVEAAWRLVASKRAVQEWFGKGEGKREG